MSSLQPAGLQRPAKPIIAMLSLARQLSEFHAPFSATVGMPIPQQRLEIGGISSMSRTAVGTYPACMTHQAYSSATMPSCFNRQGEHTAATELDAGDIIADCWNFAE